jgi:hypothetical protein
VNPEIFAEWLRRQHHRVVRTPSTWWYEASPRVFQAFPLHSVIRPPDDELLEFVRRERVLALRYSTPLDAPMGRVSYHAVCSDPQYGLAKLERRTRHCVRQGLERCRVERVPLERLATEGWTLEVETCHRQGRAVPLSQERWRRRYLSAAELPGFEGWGALVDGRLVASLLSFRIDEWCETLSQQCLTEFLRARVNHALTFVFTESTLRRPGVRSVFYALQSLDAPASVDAFKFRMGYVAMPLRQRVVFHPWAAPIVHPWIQRVVAGARRCSPRSRLLAKAEGMIRFYLEGKHPPADQDWAGSLEAARRQGGSSPSSSSSVAR